MTLQIYIYNSNDVLIGDILSSKYLDNIDKSIFDKYKVDELKKEKIVSEIFKNKYIGEYYLGEFGRPLNKDKYFNISHSHGYIAFIMSNYPIGIDIELIRPVNEDLKRYISNELEKQYIHDDISFYEIWTNKEALLKANGVGLKLKPQEIEALPINGNRIFENKIYFNKTIRYKNLIITVSRESKEEFDLEIVKETL